MADINDVLAGTAPEGYTEITGIYDCATQTPMKLNMDGTYDAVDGWDDPETPPPDPTFTQGVKWMHEAEGDDPVFAPTINTAFGRAFDYLEVYLAGMGLSIVSRDATYSSLGGSPPNYRWGYVRTSGSGNVSTSTTVFGSPCSPTEGSEECPIEAPASNDPWPEDPERDYQIAFKDGQLEVSQYDSNALDEGPLNSRTFCYDAPDGEGGLVTKTGGISTDGENGAPSGGASVYETDEQGNPKPDTIQQYNPIGEFIPPDLVQGSDFWTQERDALLRYRPLN